MRCAGLGRKHARRPGLHRKHRANDCSDGTGGSEGNAGADERSQSGHSFRQADGALRGAAAADSDGAAVRRPGDHLRICRQPAEVNDDRRSLSGAQHHLNLPMKQGRSAI